MFMLLPFISLSLLVMRNGSQIFRRLILSIYYIIIAALLSKFCHSQSLKTASQSVGCDECSVLVIVVVVFISSCASPAAVY